MTVRRLVQAMMVAGISVGLLGADRAQKKTSATEFLSPELRREQADSALNRGMLWVERGRQLWTMQADAGRKTCAGCHATPETMRGVAVRYPKVDGKSGAAMNLEMRINRCREAHQKLPALPYESEDLLSLTALVAFMSRGLPMNIDVGGQAAALIKSGETFFLQRQGQLNLACSQCHNDNVGRKLRGDTISSGLGTGYPAYRLAWQGLGSLHRRLQACQMGVRATPISAGSEEHLALEVYLAWRAQGSPIEAPAMRR